MKGRKALSILLSSLLLASFVPTATKAQTKDLKPNYTIGNPAPFKEKLKKSKINSSTKEARVNIPKKKNTKESIVDILKQKKEKNSAKKEAFITDEVIVKYKKGVSTASMESVKKKFLLGKRKSLKLVNSEVVKIPKGKKVADYIKEIQKDSAVESVQPNYKYYTSDIGETPNYYGELWGLHNDGQPIKGLPGTPDIDVDGPEARAAYNGKLTNVVVGVIDTGVDINHPELKNVIWTNTKEIPENGIDDDHNGYVDDVNGWDFYNDDNTVYDPLDGDDHGTHVSGTIAAALEGGTHNTNIGAAGIAPNVKIMPLKFLGPDGGTTAGAIAAIEYAKSMGVKITNNSWGGGEADPLLEEAINNYNGLFIAAAGNDGMNIDQYAAYPASYKSPNILSVAAVDNNGNLAPFSNYGSKSVDVAAPGVDILSTVPKFPVDEIAQVMGMDNLGAAAEINGPAYKVIYDSVGYEKYSEDSRQAAFDKAMGFLEVNPTPADPTSPAPKILLVQDDDSALPEDVVAQFPGIDTVFKDYLPVYEDLLAKYPEHTTVTISADGSLEDKGVNLNDYDAVIWFTGHGFGFLSDQFSALTTPDLDMLKEYLNSGKKLLLTGQDALFDQEGSPFVQDTLNLSVFSDFGPDLNVDGLQGGIYEGASFNIDRFESPFPAADFIQPLNPESPVQTLVNLKYNSTYNQAYDYYNGTSMATPHVTGVAALMAGLYPNMSPELVKLYLTNKGKSLPGLNGYIGSGKIVKGLNLNKFDDNKFPGAPLLKNIVNDSLNASTDKDDVYAMSLKKGEVLNLSLTGQAGTDYDLYVYRGDSNDVSNATGILAISEKSNTSSESIKFKAPEDGVYFVDVYAFKNSGTYKLFAGNFAGAYEDTSDTFSLTGDWKSRSDTQFSGGTAKVLNTAGDLSFSFVGYSFEWLGFKDATQGVADIYIDGKLEKSTSLFSGTLKAKQSILKKEYNSYGQHKVRIVWTGKSDSTARKSAAGINLDTFVVKSNPAALNVYYDSAKKQPVVTWNAVSWASSYNVLRKDPGAGDFKQLSTVTTTSYTDTTAAPGKTYQYAIAINSKDGQETPLSSSFTYIYDDDTKAALTASGSTIQGTLNFASKDINDVWSKQLEKGKTYEFKLSGPTGTDFDLNIFNIGTASIYGTSPVAKSATSGSSAETYVFTPGATGKYYIVPTAKVGSGQYTLSLAVQTTKRVENTDSGIKYTGTWSKVGYTNASGGSITQSNTVTNAIEYTFTGTGFKLYALKDKYMGLVDIYLDGTKVKQADLYSSGQQFKVNVYEDQKQQNKSHTIKIVPTGKKNSAATGTYVNVDAMDLTQFTPLN